MLSEVVGKSVHTLMESHKTLLEDMIPPKKHLLRHQPVNTQIALMDGNTFCTSLTPRLFTMDLSIVEHKVFFTEVTISFLSSIINSGKLKINRPKILFFI